MPKKNSSIPVNKMTDHLGRDISVERLCIGNPDHNDPVNQGVLEEADQAHRHDRHSFFLLESGSIQLEIDFECYTIHSPAVLYVHPDQVHRTQLMEAVVVSSLGIAAEQINPEYLKLLEALVPAKPLALDAETFAVLKEALSLSIKCSTRKSDKLQHAVLKDSCNTTIALVVSQYLEQARSAGRHSRFETVTQAFRALLEQHYVALKAPAAYAKMLNISPAYLNECVKSTTGQPVSQLIQQRVILEAKRLLYHSNQSIKEVSAALGYDDYPYFSRVFSKATGMTALAFRNKNLD